MVDTTTPEGARAHARAQAAAAGVTTQRTVPSGDASGLPDGVTAGDVVWDETLAPGGYAVARLARGTRLLLEDRAGDACVSTLLYNAHNPAERLCVADTAKVQWNAYLSQSMLLLSDMGRVLASVVSDTSGHHDLLCGASSAASNARHYGDGDHHGTHPSARDRFLVALARHDLDARDVMPCVNFFAGVRVEPDGALVFDERSRRAGATVCLRAEMDLLVVLAHVPHVLDPSPAYPKGDVRVLAWRGAPGALDDPCRMAGPEATRAYENTEELCGPPVLLSDVGGAR